MVMAMFVNCLVDSPFASRAQADAAATTTAFVAAASAVIALDEPAIWLRLRSTCC